MRRGVGKSSRESEQDPLLLECEHLAGSDGEVEHRLAHTRAHRADVDRKLGELHEALETGTLALIDVAPRIKSTARGWGQEALTPDMAKLADLQGILGYIEKPCELLEPASF